MGEEPRRLAYFQQRRLQGKRQDLKRSIAELLGLRQRLQPEVAAGENPLLQLSSMWKTRTLESRVSVPFCISAIRVLNIRCSDIHDGFTNSADSGLPLEFLELPEHFMNTPTIDEEEDSVQHECFHSTTTTCFGVNAGDPLKILKTRVLTKFFIPATPQRSPGIPSIVRRRSFAFCSPTSLES